MPQIIIKVLKDVFFKKDHVLKHFTIISFVCKGDMILKNFDHYPKSIKKAIRYIKQDAEKEQLEEIRKLIDYAIQKRSLKSK